VSDDSVVSGSPPQPLAWKDIHCQECPFWDGFAWSEKCKSSDTGEEHEYVRGLCKAKEPVIGVDGEKGQWPVTNHDDWCVPGRMAVMEAQSDEEEPSAEESPLEGEQ
jgi:hypothetical protein